MNNSKNSLIPFLKLIYWDLLTAFLCCALIQDIFEIWIVGWEKNNVFSLVAKHGKKILSQVTNLNALHGHWTGRVSHALTVSFTWLVKDSWVTPMHLHVCLVYRSPLFDTSKQNLCLVADILSSLFVMSDQDSRLYQYWLWYRFFK